MMASFPELLKNARLRAGLSTRQLKDELEASGVRASVTLVNQIENSKTKPTLDFAYSAASSVGFSAEEALRAAFLFRIEWCINREKAALESFMKDNGFTPQQIENISALKIES